MTRSVVGLGRGVPFERDNALWRALGAAFEVEFESVTDPATPGLAGLILDGEQDPASSLERLDRPVLVYHVEAPHTTFATSIGIGPDPEVDEPFRGCALDEDAAAVKSLTPDRAERVLASSEKGPIWTVREGAKATCFRVAARWPRLGPKECLRDQFRGGRFSDLLPLVHFLARITGGARWRRPPMRATFLLDDPNLHLPGYGFLDYDRAASEARRASYHLAIATVPLDTWFTHPRAAEVFRQNADQLSLLIHGNNHLRQELGQGLSTERYERILAQGLRRIARFEENQGIPVARVMAAPHGRCDENAARALFRCGYDALCISRPYPWLERPPADRLLAGWYPAEYVTGGLPVLPRHSVRNDRQDLRFRAWLGHPLIVYGHHDDLATDRDDLPAIAEWIDGLGPVHWTGLRSIVETNHWTRSAGAELEVLLFSSRVRVRLPPGTSQLRILIPAPGATVDEAMLWVAGARHRLRATSDGDRLTSEAIACGGNGFVEVTFRCADPVDIDHKVRPSRHVWPYARRLLTESRDRVVPILRR